MYSQNSRNADILVSMKSNVMENNSKQQQQKELAEQCCKHRFAKVRMRDQSSWSGGFGQGQDSLPKIWKHSQKAAPLAYI